MKTFLLSAVLLLAIQASDCATAGSIHDSSVTREKRAADSQRNLYQEQVAPTPTPVIMREVHSASFPADENTQPQKKLPQLPRQAPEVAER